MNEKPRILLVDDEEMNIRLLQAMLDGDYELISAKNGKEALEKVAEERPDLVLLDVMMPEMDGFKACRKIKEDAQWKIIPVLMLTSLASKEDRIQAMEAGADDFLSKPFDRTELLVRIKSLVRMKSYHDQLIDKHKEIEEKNEILSQLERSKEELTHMIVHDLNIPLTGIIVCLDMVFMDTVKLSPEHAAWLTDCMNQSKYLSGMIKNILDIGRMEQGKLELSPRLADPEKIAESVISLMRSKVDGKKISLSMNVSDDVSPICMDPDLIQRVLANLLDNAIRNTPTGEEIEITIREDSKTNEIIFSIRDSGKGLKDEYHNTIFDKYCQVENSQAGATSGRCGLGLVYCKMAVEAHGGRIGVENCEGRKGTAFVFTLPVNYSLDEESNLCEKKSIPS